MDGSHHINPGVTGQSGLARKLARAMLGGGSVALVGETGTAEVLASAGRLLGAGSAHVVRAHPPLELPEFLEQVASVSPMPGQSALERAYEVLTVAGPGYDRVVLLVEEAHALPHPTLHYIEMAMRAGPKLQVALAGQPALVGKLALDGFTSLRQRLVVMDLPPEPSMEPAVQEQALPVTTPRAERGWRLDVLAGALGMGVAALAVLLHAYGPSAAPPKAVAAARAPQPAPEPPRILAEVEIIMVPPVVPEPPAALVEAARVAPAPVAEAPDAASPEPLAMSAAASVSVRPVPRPGPARAERAVPVPSVPAQNDRRCRDIVLRAQLGDAPDNADQTFLRNGCR